MRRAQRLSHSVAFNRRPVRATIRPMRAPVTLAIVLALAGPAFAQTLPNGRLSPSSDPVVTADVIASNTLHYTDSETDIQLSMAGLNGPLDVYQTSPSAIATTTFGTSVINGSQRVNGAAFTGCAQYACAFLGAVNPVSGLLTTQVSFTPGPRWDVWNFYNQRTIKLRAGGGARLDITAAPGTAPAPFWQRISAALSANIFSGLPAVVDVQFDQAVNTLAPPGGSAWGATAIGWNSTSVPSGFWGEFGLDLGVVLAGNGIGPGASVRASYIVPSMVGSHVVSGLGWARVIGSVPPIPPFPAQTTFFGVNENNAVLTVKWKG